MVSLSLRISPDKKFLKVRGTVLLFLASSLAKICEAMGPSREFGEKTSTVTQVTGEGSWSSVKKKCQFLDLF